MIRLLLKPKKAITVSVLLFTIIADIFIVFLMLGLQGCSTSSPLFSSRNDRASIVIEKPPTRIILSGEYNEVDVDNVIKVMEELRKHPYHNYHFNDTININSEQVSTTTESHSYPEIQNQVQTD